MAAAAPAPQKPAAARDLKVLLVDDESLIRSSTAEILTELGAEVYEAGDAVSALAILEREGIDLLLTDIGLPGMSGAALAVEARRRRPGLPIVFASGRDVVPAEGDGDELAGAILLVKPYTETDIAAALAAATAT
jgi:DNA-binding response OmpR family regulator